jgi:hypothetical protein
MAAKAAEPAKSLVKREPVVVGSAILTLISTALYVLPSINPKIKIPDKAAKIISVGLQLAGSFGLRQLVKPV